ncbi:hypothetical protein Q5M85_03890 [Paraclostridium bifermentans]|nr:hypothetical protein [Paraclostridium bifermentans]
MVDVSDNRIFTIAAVGNLDNIELLLIEDDINEVPSTKEALHLGLFIYLLDHLLLILLLITLLLFEDIDFKENTDYIKSTCWYV